MSWLAEAHADWHTANRHNPHAVCPLDCYDSPEPEGWYDDLSDQGDSMDAMYDPDPATPADVEPDDPWYGTDIELAFYDDDPSPYDGTYSEM